MNRPWMPLYVADYLRDTSHLRAIESGAYLHLIMAYWANGKLPNDDRQLATIAKVTDKEWSKVKKVVAGFFGEDWSSHKRIDHELAEAEEKYKKRAAAGKAGGEAAAKSKQCSGNAVAETHQPQSQSESKKGEGADAPPRPIKKDRRRATQFPDGMSPDRESQRNANLTEAEGDREFIKFRNHAREKGRTCIDWRAAEANWYLKAADFMGRKPIKASAAEAAIPTPSEFEVKRFKDAGAWNVLYGPEPGKPGCRASPEDLEKHGYGRAA